MADRCRHLPPPGKAGKDGAAAPEHQFIRVAIDLYDTYSMYVVSYFAGASLFHKALKEAFETFCNKQVCLRGLLCTGMDVKAWTKECVSACTARFADSAHRLPRMDECCQVPRPCLLLQIGRATVAEAMASFCDSLLRKVGDVWLRFGWAPCIDAVLCPVWFSLTTRIHGYL